MGLLAITCFVTAIFAGCETKVETTMRSGSQDGQGSIDIETSSDVRRYEKDFTQESVIENEWAKLVIPAGTFSEPYAVEVAK